MGIYFSLISNGNGAIIIDRIKLLYIGNIWDKVLEKNNSLNGDNCMKIGKEYHIDINEFPKIIEYYENILKKGNNVVIRYGLLEPLKKELDYRVSEHKDYIIELS